MPMAQRWAFWLVKIEVNKMKIVFFSGAGLSADSGLSTFRNNDGLWEQYDLDVVCNINTWRQNYDAVHEFYNLARREYKAARPNAMHTMIADLQNEMGSQNVIVITQNVDTLLEKAGCKEVMHVHGRIDYIHCVHCFEKIYIEDEFKHDIVCKCGCKKFKPSIVFFNEAAPLYRDMYRAFESLSRGDMVVVVGTNGSVVPIDMILGDKKSGCKADRILCNLEKSEYIDEANYDFVFYEKAADAAGKIRDIVLGRLNGVVAYKFGCVRM